MLFLFLPKLHLSLTAVLLFGLFGFAVYSLFDIKGTHREVYRLEKNLVSYEGKKQARGNYHGDNIEDEYIHFRYDSEYGLSLMTLTEPFFWFVFVGSILLSRNLFFLAS